MTYLSPSAINASAGASGFFQYVNTVTDYWFGNFCLIAIFLIVLISYYKAKEDFVGGLAVSGFALFSIGLFMWLGTWITDIAFGIVVGLSIVSVIPLFVGNNNN